MPVQKQQIYTHVSNNVLKNIQSLFDGLDGKEKYTAFGE